VTDSSNLDLARSIFAAWGRGDLRSAQWAHPEIEFVAADGLLPGTWKGLPGLVDGVRDFLSAWEHATVEAEEYRELDDERVLVLVRYGGRGKASGLEIGQMRARGAWVLYVQRTKVVRLVRYLDRERALADLGLAPETDSR
jgi:ketosteroid isomerase-like protein